MSEFISIGIVVVVAWLLVYCLLPAMFPSRYRNLKGKYDE
jgi:hypothetical protein